MLEAALDADVRGVVDHGLDAQGPPFLEVLLHPAMLVEEVDLHLRPGREDARTEDAGRVLAHLAGKDDGHLVRPADADVVGDERLEEGTVLAAGFRGD